MYSLKVYKIKSEIPPLPAFLVRAIGELDARRIATGSLIRFPEVERQIKNGIPMVNESYFNAECQELEMGKDYDLLNELGGSQISIRIGDRRYVVSRDTATSVTDYQKMVY